MRFDAMKLSGLAGSAWSLPNRLSENRDAGRKYLMAWPRSGSGASMWMHCFEVIARFRLPSDNLFASTLDDIVLARDDEEGALLIGAENVSPICTARSPGLGPALRRSVAVSSLTQYLRMRWRPRTT